MDILSLHHVSVPVTNLGRSKAFYRDVIGLEEIPRPAFPFPGAWFRIAGAQELHLIAESGGTFRSDGLVLTDIHFAVRVASHGAAKDRLLALGYRETSPEDDPKGMRITSGAGYPQIFICDPDRNLVEINAHALD